MEKSVVTQKILLVEDLIEYQAMVKMALESIYDLHVVDSAGEAIHRLSQESFDLLLLDLGLPDFDGYHVCRMIREGELNQHIPIIILSAKNQLQDKTLAYKMGADDFLEKPFHTDELKAKINANIKRPHRPRYNAEDHMQEFIFSGLKLKLQSHSFYVDNELVKLTKTEFLILKVLFQEPNKVFSRENLLDLVWRSRTQVTDRTVDSHLSKLRAKLGPYGKALQSVHGFGYRFNPDDLSS